MRFKDKIVLITGAGGQLGSQFAHSFCKEGALVWLADSSADRLNSLKNELPQSQIVGLLSFDISQPKQVEDSFKQIRETSKRLDVLINNAGIGTFTPFWERDYSEFMNVLSVNVGGTFLCTREALKMMRDYKSGNIVNIGSIYGVVSSDPRIYTDCARMNSEVYSASKAGVIQMTRYFSVHAAEFGVRVNCVSPGGVFNQQGDDFVKNYSNRTPLNRMAESSEMTGAVLFLASTDASYVSGQNIVVDGGFTSW